MAQSVTITSNTSFYIYNFRFNFIVKLINLRYNVYIVSPIDKYTQYLIDLGCIHYPVKINSKSLNPFVDFYLLIKLFFIYYRIRPDIVLNFTHKPNIYSTIVAKIFRAEVINNIAGLGIGFVKKNFKTKILIFLYKYSQKLASIVYFQNIDDYNYFIENNIINKDKCRILPGSGVDINKFNFVQVNVINSNKFIFLFNSRMLYSKGVEHLFHAGIRLLNDCLNFEIVLYGLSDVSNTDAISSEQIQNWSKYSFFKYMGFTDDIKSAIINSHCVILPSFYKEGTPKSLLESLSIGRPIITTDMPGCRDTVSNGNGFLVKPNDVDSLYTAMKNIILLPFEDLVLMGHNSRKLAIDKFDDKIVINDYLISITTCLSFPN